MRGARAEGRSRPRWRRGGGGSSVSAGGMVIPTSSADKFKLVKCSAPDQIAFCDREHDYEHEHESKENAS